MADDIQEILEQKIADGQEETTVDTYYDVSNRVARELGDLFIAHRNKVTKMLEEMAGPKEVIASTREELLETMCRDLAQIHSEDKDAIRRELQGHFARNVLNDLVELYPELPTRESGFLPDFDGDPFATEAFEKLVKLKAKVRSKPFESDVAREEQLIRPRLRQQLLPQKDCILLERRYDSVIVLLELERIVSI